MAQFGARFDAQGVLAGSKDASRCIGYLTKYLTKHIGDHQAATDAQAAHAGQLAERAALRAVLPDVCRAGFGTGSSRRTPGRACGGCKGKAHRREYLGYAGRRVLVSRKWSGKTLADHRADRRTWLTGMLGLPATDPARYTWESVKPGDPDHMPTANGCCTSSPTGSNGRPPSNKPAAEPPRRIFRQLVEGGIDTPRRTCPARTRSPVSRY